MINQDVLKYINDELAKGTSREVITSNLMSGGGWTMEDIVFHFGFAKAPPAVVVPTPPPAPILAPETQKQSLSDMQGLVNNITATPITIEKSVSPVLSSTSSPQVLTAPISIQANRTKEKNAVFKILALTFVGALIIVGAGFGYKYYLEQQSTKVETPALSQTSVPDEIPLSQPLINSSEEDNQTTTTTTTTRQEQEAAVTFEGQLRTCTKYKTTFIHPFSGETLEKEILGIISEKCNYIEQMPGGGKMECKYTESERVAIAQYYNDISAAESLETNVNSDLGNGNQKTTYKVNGKLVENPLQEAMDNGACVITGY